MENCNPRLHKVLGWTTGEPDCLHFSLKSHFIVKRNKIHSYLGLHLCFSRIGLCPPVALTASGFLFILKENLYFISQFLSLSLRETKTGIWREVLMPKPWRSAVSCLCKWFSIACSGMPIMSLLQKFVYTCRETLPLFQKNIWPPVILTDLLSTPCKHDFVLGDS